MSGWVALYELLFQDRMRFPIPHLVRDVLDHFEVAPSESMPNFWRLLMSMECLNMQHNVECGLRKVLFSYYLNEHDKDKGSY